MQTVSVRAENAARLADECPFVYVTQILGTQWRPAVLYTIGSGVTTYNALRAALPPITDKTLANELVALVEHGLVVRIALREKPLRSRYELTERGRSLLPVLAAMKAWTAADRTGVLSH